MNAPDPNGSPWRKEPPTRAEVLDYYRRTGHRMNWWRRDSVGERVLQLAHGEDGRVFVLAPDGSGDTWDIPIGGQWAPCLPPADSATPEYGADDRELLIDALDFWIFGAERDTSGSITSLENFNRIPDAKRLIAALRAPVATKEPR